MRKRRSIAPTVEPLGSRLLLSTIAPASRRDRADSVQLHAERHASAVAPVAIVDLQGTIRGAVNISSNGRQGTLVGSGNLGAVGLTSLRSQFLAGSSTEPLAVLSTKHGKIDFITAGLERQITGSSISSVGTYTITGGTGSYAHTTGTGTFRITLTPTSLSRIGADLTFS